MSIKSEKWDTDALEDVRKWLKLHITTFPKGKEITGNNTARCSRDIGKISHEGNRDGVRQLLTELDREGYIHFPNPKNLVYIVIEKD